ncbi:DUF3024 domain-containing protein [Maridesulfovibrio sp. FT414]|uniref:DUF3024 domain-containing protein n=1 Tax=Maridesulfovibrio sp. FT414 TaxID=2979469 RepID=UPI003D80834F
MAFSEFETFRYSKTMEDFINEAGPPKDIAHELKWKYEINPRNQSVELCEVRPYFMDASELVENHIFKARYIKGRKEWLIYWMRADLKWHLYEPAPYADTLDDVLGVIKEDALCCFFG